MGRVGRRLTDAIEAATGERIVAFARAGKSPENPFCGDFPEGSRRAPDPTEYPHIPQRLLKPSGVGL